MRPPDGDTLGHPPWSYVIGRAKQHGGGAHSNRLNSAVVARLPPHRNEEIGIKSTLRDYL